MKIAQAAKYQLLIGASIFLLVSLLISIGGYLWLESEKHENILEIWMWQWGWPSISSAVMSYYLYTLSSFGIAFDNDNFIILRRNTEVARSKFNSVSVSENFISTPKYLVQYKIGGQFDLFSGHDLQDILQKLKKNAQKLDTSTIYKTQLKNKHPYIVLITIWVIFGIVCYLKVSFSE